MLTHNIHPCKNACAVIPVKVYLHIYYYIYIYIYTLSHTITHAHNISCQYSSRTALVFLVSPVHLPRIYEPAQLNYAQK